MKKWSSQRGSQFPQSHGPQRKESLLIGIKRKIRKSTVVAIGIAPVLVFYCVVTFGQNCKAGERSRNPDLYEAGTAPWLVSHAENHRLREKSKQKMPTQPGKSNEYKNANEARFTQSAAMAGERKQSSEKQIVSQRSLLGKSGMEDDSMMLIVMLKVFPLLCQKIRIEVVHLALLPFYRGSDCLNSSLYCEAKVCMSA